MATKIFCNICDTEITDIIGIAKLIYFEKVSKLGEQGVEDRINKAEVDICSKCSQPILKIVKKK